MMRRRWLLSALSSIGIAAWAPWARGGSLVDEAGQRLLAVLRRRASAATIGRAYLASHPEEAERRHLAGSLTHELRCRGCDPRVTPEAFLRAAIGREIRRDFAQRRVVTVDGWVLSRTEARLCALAALA